MRRLRTWLWLAVVFPVVLAAGILLFFWSVSSEPELNGQPLSEHLLKLRQSDEEVRASTLKLIEDHPSLFGPYCLDMVAEQGWKIFNQFQR